MRHGIVSSCQSAATSKIVKRCCSILVSSAVASTQTFTFTHTLCFQAPAQTFIILVLLAHRARFTAIHYIDLYLLTEVTVTVTDSVFNLDSNWLGFLCFAPVDSAWTAGTSDELSRVNSVFCRHCCCCSQFLLDQPTFTQLCQIRSVPVSKSLRISGTRLSVGWTPLLSLTITVSVTERT